MSKSPIAWQGCSKSDSALTTGTEVEFASEFRYRNPIVEEGTVAVAVSQSGETADTLAAIQEAKRRGATTLGVVNVVGSSIARETDAGVYLRVGPEIGVASTKTFLGQMLVLYILCLKLAQRRNDIKKEIYSFRYYSYKCLRDISTNPRIIWCP